MLSNSQIDVLKYIVNNADELIIDCAIEGGISNSENTIGIASFIVAHSDNFSKMTKNQKYHYDNGIKPLIVDVLCYGMFGDREDGSSTCTGNNFIDEDELLIAYQTDEMYCQHCRYDMDKISRE